MKGKRVILSLLLFLLSLACAVGLVACGEPGGKPGGDQPSGPAATSISLSPADVTLTVGEELDYADFQITVSYDDGTTGTVTLTAAMISEEDKGKLSEVGEHELTVTCMGKTTTLSVTVDPMEMGEVTVQPVTKTYDGTPAAMPAVSGAPQGASVSYEIFEGTSAEGTPVQSAVNAGSYFVKVTVSARNYATVEKTSSITIDKAVFDLATLTWENTKYIHTGEEITLEAQPVGLPEGFTFSGFTATSSQATSATETGTYTATANFTGENPNYTLSAASCVVSWRIVTGVESNNWYAVQGGTLLKGEFGLNSASKPVFIFNGAESSYELSYEGEVPSITISGYTAASVEDDVLRLVASDSTVYVLIPEAALNNFAGEYSMYVEDFTIAFDYEAGTAKLVSTLRGEGPVTRNLTLQVPADGTVDDAALLVDGTDMSFIYTADAGKVGLTGYANPANFDQVDSDPVYLATKDEAEELMQFTAGQFVDAEGANTFVVGEDGSLTYNGYALTPYCSYYYSSYGLQDLEIYLSLDSNNTGEELVIDAGYYTIGGDAFIPAEYIGFAGVYYLKDGEGLHVGSDYKISFLEYTSYFDVRMLGTTYTFGAEASEGSLALSLQGGVLTATLTKDSDVKTLVFDRATGTLTYEGGTYIQADPLLENYSSWSGGEYINGKGEVVTYSTSSATFTVKGETSTAYTIARTGEETTVTVTLASGSAVIRWGADNRFITVDGVLYVYSNLESDTDGRTADEVYSDGENSIVFDGNVYAINEKVLQDVTYTLVDDGNGNGRMVLQATGTIDGVSYTVLHYSQAAWLVNGDVYVADVFAGIYGTEYKPAESSSDVFVFEDSGKMLFRGTEVFITSPDSYSHFYCERDGRLYYFSFDVNGTFIQFNDAVVWNVRYYPAAYFTFSGAYVSEDRTQAFYFGDEVVYYNGTSTESFTVVTTETGATMTVGGLQAVFTNGTGGATLTYDGVTYTREPFFSLAPYARTYTVYNGTESGTTLTYDPANTSWSAPQMTALILYNGELTPVITYNYSDRAYLIRNTDGQTMAQLPYLAVQDKYADLVCTEQFQGKTLSITLGVRQKPNSTDRMPSLNVVYNGETVELGVVNAYASVFKAELGGTEYYLRPNTDAETSSVLPLLVFDGWWYDYDGSESKLNGKTVRLEIAVGGTDDAPEAVLQVTYDGAVVDAEFSVAASGYSMEFTKDGVNYVGVLSDTAVLDVSVYTEAEYEFFFAAGFKNTVGGKELVFPVTITHEFDSYYSGYTIVLDTAGTTAATYGGEAITRAQYLYNDGVLVFETAGESYAYDIAADKLYTDVLPEGSDFRDAENEGAYGSVFEDMKIDVRFTSFNKESRKAVLGFYFDDTFRGEHTNLAQAVRVSETLYKLTGKNAEEEQVTLYLEKQTDGSFALYTESEYLFTGEFTVGEKTLVIERTVSEGVASYTAAYDGDEPVAIEPDFTSNSFALQVGAEFYVFSWTVEEGELVFTVQAVPAAAMQFVCSGSWAYDTYYYSEDILLDISVSGIVDGQVTFNVTSTGYYNGSGIGTLSEDGTHILVTLGYSTHRIYLNSGVDPEGYIEYIFVRDSVTAADLFGTFTTADDQQISILLSATSEDDEGVPTNAKPAIVVTYNGKACECSTSYRDSLSSVEFTCEGKTYTAKFVDGVMTVTEQA